MEHQFHLETASWRFGSRTEFLNSVYSGATTGGDSNSSYKLQEPARRPRRASIQDQPLAQKVLAAKWILLPHPSCPRWSRCHAQTPQHRNLDYHAFAEESHGHQKSFDPLGLLRSSAKAGIPASSARQGALPPGCHCTGSPSLLPMAMLWEAAPERAKHTRHQCPGGRLWFGL